MHMWGIRLKSFNTILLLAAATSLAVAWFYLSHIWFAAVGGVALLGLPAIISMRDTWRQTDQASLAARGITPESVRLINSIDGGLKREATGFVPVGVIRRMTGKNHAVIIGATAMGAQPARLSPSGAGRAGQGDRRDRRDRKRELLPPEATVTLAEERRAAGIDDIFTTLDRELIGLVPVKKKVEEIGSLLLVDRARQRFGLSASRPNLHMCFTGAPGTGKTTVALKLADLLRRLGYLEQGHLVHAMRDDLVGEYIGHTAPKTRQVLERAMGGVLFIDEAYSLYRADDSKDYGQECIEILLQVMENDRDNLVVILAGYKNRMDHFFDSNPGMSSRVAHHLEFADYGLDELLEIGRLMLDRSSYYLSDEATSAFREYMAMRMAEPRFANARTVRNELERARLQHAYRLAADPDREQSKDDLMRLEAADVMLSLAFGRSPEDRS
jgi:probable Rubsico expression protein CbbX